MLLAVAAWLLIVRQAELEPRARQLAQMVSSVANLTRAALLAARPESRHDLLAELSDTEGVYVYPADTADVIKPPPPRPLTRRLENLLRERLGPETQLAFMLNGHSGLFVRFRIFSGDEGNFWLALPRERLERHVPLEWLGWGIAVLLLALLGAWLIVLRITRPLRALQAAATKIGAGETPPPLTHQGPEELQAVIQAFNQMSANLRQLEEDRRLLLAGISHDLRTPLTRLRMETEMSVADPEARSAMADDIQEMDRTIGQFLDFARPPAAPDAQQITPLCAVFPLLDELASRYGIVLCRPASADFSALAIRAQPEGLRRALVNLLENALRHGGQAAPVELAMRVENGELVIAVLDRGPGIAAADIARLKQPFARGTTARTDAVGAGLGLAIVERILHADGGRLELLPRPGGGLAAEIQLPLIKLPLAATPAEND
jgi:two-component system osmolarity sensor histidine kinase EnvZ